jgi:hypothetical protein
MSRKLGNPNKTVEKLAEKQEKKAERRLKSLKCVPNRISLAILSIQCDFRHAADSVTSDLFLTAQGGAVQTSFLQVWGRCTCGFCGRDVRLFRMDTVEFSHPNASTG